MTRLPRVLGVVAVVAVLAAAWFGWSWWQAAHDDGLVRARDRDAVLAATGDALVTLNTIDYRDGSEAIDRWLAVTAGGLGTSLGADRKAQLDRATSAQLVATASVQQIAVVSLDGDAAQVIAVLDVSIASRGGEPKPGRSHVIADAQRADGTWKITSVQAAS